MIAILWVVALLQIAEYVYAPFVCIYGGIQLLHGDDPLAVICDPILGLKMVSIRRGCIIWAAQLILLGGVIYDLCSFYLNGTKPILSNLI